MPSNTRRQNRRRGRDGLAREPFAAGIALAENPNRGKRNASPLAWRQRTLDSLDAIAALENADPRNLPGASWPGTDSLGRRNPRMARRQYGPATIERES